MSYKKATITAQFDTEVHPVIVLSSNELTDNLLTQGIAGVEDGNALEAYLENIVTLSTANSLSFVAHQDRERNTSCFSAGGEWA